MSPNASPATPTIGRRTLTRGAVWSLPVMTVGALAPHAAASGGPDLIATNGVIVSYADDFPFRRCVSQLFSGVTVSNRGVAASGAIVEVRLAGPAPGARAAFTVFLYAVSAPSPCTAADGFFLFAQQNQSTSAVDPSYAVTFTGVSLPTGGDFGLFVDANGLAASSTYTVTITVVLGTQTLLVASSTLTTDNQGTSNGFTYP